ncbi:hypothetical protein Tco_0579001, partial [Tanacetum coccineum]
RPKVSAIEESKDLSTLPLDELIGNLKVYEVVLEKDSDISKVKKEKYKSLALKARKVSIDEEVSCSKSNDEEYAMAVRDFKKLFRIRGKFVRQPHDDKKNFRKIKEDKKEKEDRRYFKCEDPNHFISDCPKHSYNGQKEFVVGCWSDSEDDSKKEEIYLKALDNNEVRLKVKLESDEWIKDSGCPRHMTGNKDLFSSYKAIDGGKITIRFPLKTPMISPLEIILALRSKVSLIPVTVRKLGMQGVGVIRVRMDMGDKEVTKQDLVLKGGDRGACKLLGDMVVMSWRCLRR